MTTAATTCQALPQSLRRPWEAETVVLILQKRKLRLREAHLPRVTEPSSRVVAVWPQGVREEPAEGKPGSSSGSGVGPGSLGLTLRRLPAFKYRHSSQSWMRPQRRSPGTAALARKGTQ